jgi:hypothetical protein
MAGFFNGRVSGGIDAGRRLFAPTAAISANLATTNPSSWSFLMGAGTITTGVASPDGNSAAGRAMSNSGQSQVQFFVSNNVPVALGDVYIYGTWVRSQTANGYSNGIPLVFGLNANGYGSGDGCAPGGGILFPSLLTGDGQWEWYSGLCKVYTNPVKAGIYLAGSVDSRHTAEFYNPVLIKIPAGTKSDNEVFEIANNLSTWSTSCSAGQICGTASQTLNMAAYSGFPTLFVNLGTPANGTFLYCSDCKIANPCAGGGTGALAKRLNGIWVCN